MALLFDNTTAVTGITATPATTAILGLVGSLVLTLETEIPVVVSTVGGTPDLTLSNGGRASYSGIDDGGRPQFTYRPAAGEDTGNLTVTGLITNGGSIRGRERTSFASAGDVTVGNGAFSVTTADLNGDRRPDLLVANSGSGTVSVRLGVGNGTFAPAPDVTVGMGPVSVATADLNGDRRPDLLVANLASSTVSVRLGAGDGTFTSAADVGVGLRPSSLTTADVNGDGRPDLLVADLFGEWVSVRLGKGDGTFTQGEDPVAPYSSSVTTADLNGDGSQDLLVANPVDRTVAILGGVGNGTFSMSLRPIRFTVGDNPTSVTTADVNGDGRPDILVANQGSGTVSVLVKTGGSSLERGTKLAWAG